MSGRCSVRRLRRQRHGRSRHTSGDQLAASACHCSQCYNSVTAGDRQQGTRSKPWSATVAFCRTYGYSVLTNLAYLLQLCRHHVRNFFFLPGCREMERREKVEEARKETERILTAQEAEVAARKVGHSPAGCIALSLYCTCKQT